MAMTTPSRRGEPHEGGPSAKSTRFRLLGTLVLPVPWPYVLVFVTSMLLVAGFISYHVASERRAAIKYWQARMSTITDDRARLVGSWIEARRAEVEAATALAPVRALLAGGRSVGADLQNAASLQLDQLVQAQRHTGIWVTDRNGLLVARSTQAGDMPSTATDLALVAIRSGGFRIALLPGPGRIDDLGLALPVGTGGGTRGAVDLRSAPGAVVLRMSPAQTLFPLVTAETVPTSTGEMLLFHVAGSEARYLSPFRHGVAGRQSLQVSRQQLALHAQAAAAGRDSLVELSDYRGVPAFAIIRWLAPVGWGLVLKIDRAEALADFQRAATMAVLAGVFLAVALGALLVGLVRHRQRADLLDAKMHQERALWNLRSYAETIVASIPSGLLVLSGDLRILSANRAFLQGFGLRLDDVLGRRLEGTLHAEGLLPRLREALDTGVARHDLLTDVVVLSRRESRPARITMTGIHVADDEDARLLLIVHDLSEEEPRHAARRASAQRFHELTEEAIRHSEDQIRPAPKTEGGGQQTVLLVEDADRVREVVREILELSGYRVLEAHDGQEALGIAHQHQGPIHLLIADVMMPHMSGRELTRRLLALRPQTRVLYMSGARDDSIGSHEGLEAGMSFIAKPFRPDALTAKVRQALEDPPSVNGAAAGPDGRLPQLVARR